MLWKKAYWFIMYWLLVLLLLKAYWRSDVSKRNLVTVYCLVLESHGLESPTGCYQRWKDGNGLVYGMISRYSIGWLLLFKVLWVLCLRSTISDDCKPLFERLTFDDVFVSYTVTNNIFKCNSISVLVCLIVFRVLCRKYSMTMSIYHLNFHNLAFCLSTQRKTPVVTLKVDIGRKFLQSTTLAAQVIQYKIHL